MAKSSSVDDLKRIKALKEPPPLLLILCPDNIRRDRLIRHLVDSFYPTLAASTGLEKLSCAELGSKGVSGLRDRISSLSLFSPERVFLLYDVQELKAQEAKELLTLSDSIPPKTTVIICGTSLPSNSTFLKHFSTLGMLIELTELKGFELSRWIKKEFAANGVKEVGDEAIAFITELGGSNPDRTTKIIEQASIYVDNSKIDLADLRKLFFAHADPGEFLFLDTITEKKVQKSEIMLHDLIQNGRNPFVLVSLFFRTFSNLYLTRSLLDRGLAPVAIREKLKMQPWLFNKNLSAAKGYSKDKLRSILGAILGADSKLKNKNLGPEAIFGELISKIVR